jgi:hypothetical protein
MLSRTVIFRTTLSPIVPLFLAWPTSPPISFPRQTWLSRPVGTSQSTFRSLLNWPPVPIVATFLFPVTQSIYRNLFQRLTHWVLETKPTPIIPPRRIIWNLNQEGGVNVEIGFEHADAQAADRPRGGQGRDAVAENAADAAARTQNVNNASLGRLVGGALIIPRISNIMGSLLFRLSKHSYWLRRFLAAKPPLSTGLLSYGIFHPEPITDVRQFVKLVIDVVFGETNIWHEADPVW